MDIKLGVNLNDEFEAILEEGDVEEFHVGVSDDFRRGGRRVAEVGEYQESHQRRPCCINEHERDIRQMKLSTHGTRPISPRSPGSAHGACRSLGKLRSHQPHDLCTRRLYS